MLNIKYYDHFKGEDTCLLVSGTRADYQDTLARILTPESEIFAPHNLGPLKVFDIRFSEPERSLLYDACTSLLESNRPGHIYFELDRLQHIQFILSMDEYAGMP